MESICIVAGTRPEIIKLAPVYRELRKRSERKVVWLSTGQHTDLADQTLGVFDIQPDLKLELTLRRPAKRKANDAVDSVARLLAQLIHRLDEVLARTKPSLVVVQGDTTSAVAAGIAGFCRRIPVAHVEAGLRTFDLSRPFPEEGWRSVLGHLATLHFAPTKTAAQNLVRCGLSRDAVSITGNTVIDALHWLLDQSKANAPVSPRIGRRMVLVTMHRRENWQHAFSDVCTALLNLRDRVGDIEICFVLHANPALRQRATRELEGQERIRLIEPLAYSQFVQLLQQSTLILSDSGGVQEEAPALGIPVLVLRDSTERPEAVDAGVAQLVGTDATRIVDTATRLLTDRAAYDQMARKVNPFGDGRAAMRIAAEIDAYLMRTTATIA